MQPPSLPDIAATLRMLVQAMPPEIVDLTDDQWLAAMESKEYWAERMADLLRIDEAALPPMPPPPRYWAERMADLLRIDEAALPPMPPTPPDPMFALLREAGEARLALEDRLEELRSSPPFTRRSEDIVVMQEKYKAAEQFLSHADRILQWIRSKTDLTAELGEYGDIDGLTREIRRIAERVDDPAPSCAPVQEELRTATDTLGPVYDKACQATGRYCVESWHEADQVLHVVGDRETTREVWLEAWRATITYVRVRLAPAQLLRDNLKKRLEEATAERGAARDPVGREVAVVPDATSTAYVFRLDGQIWRVRYGTESGSFTDSKGMQYIAQLLGRVNRRIPALELVGRSGTRAPATHAEQARADDEAYRCYQERLQQLQEQLKEANDEGDMAEVEKLERERECLAKEIKAARGLGGRKRSLGSGSAATKATDAARQVLRRAYKAMELSMPLLVDHLRSSLKAEGITYAYYPPAPVPGWDF